MDGNFNILVADGSFLYRVSLFFLFPQHGEAGAELERARVAEQHPRLAPALHLLGAVPQGLHPQLSGNTRARDCGTMCRPLPETRLLSRQQRAIAARDANNSEDRDVNKQF